MIVCLVIVLLSLFVVSLCLGLMLVVLRKNMLVVRCCIVFIVSVFLVIMEWCDSLLLIRIIWVLECFVMVRVMVGFGVMMVRFVFDGRCCVIVRVVVLVFRMIVVFGWMFVVVWWVMCFLFLVVSLCCFIMGGFVVGIGRVFLYI